MRADNWPPVRGLKRFVDDDPTLPEPGPTRRRRDRDVHGSGGSRQCWGDHVVRHGSGPIRTESRSPGSTSGRSSRSEGEYRWVLHFDLTPGNCEAAGGQSGIRSPQSTQEQVRLRNAGGTTASESTRTSERRPLAFAWRARSVAKRCALPPSATGGSQHPSVPAIRVYLSTTTRICLSPRKRNDRAEVWRVTSDEKRTGTTPRVWRTSADRDRDTGPSVNLWPRRQVDLGARRMSRSRSRKIRTRWHAISKSG